MSELVHNADLVPLLRASVELGRGGYPAESSFLVCEAARVAFSPNEVFRTYVLLVGWNEDGQFMTYLSNDSTRIEDHAAVLAMRLAQVFGSKDVQEFDVNDLFEQELIERSKSPNLSRFRGLTSRTQISSSSDKRRRRTYSRQLLDVYRDDYIGSAQRSAAYAWAALVVDPLQMKSISGLRTLQSLSHTPSWSPRTNPHHLEAIDEFARMRANVGDFRGASRVKLLLLGMDNRTLAADVMRDYNPGFLRNLDLVTRKALATSTRFLDNLLPALAVEIYDSVVLARSDYKTVYTRIIDGGTSSHYQKALPSPMPSPRFAEPMRKRLTRRLTERRSSLQRPARLYLPTLAETHSHLAIAPAKGAANNTGLQVKVDLKNVGDDGVELTVQVVAPSFDSPDSDPGHQEEEISAVMLSAASNAIIFSPSWVEAKVSSRSGMEPVGLVGKPFEHQPWVIDVTFYNSGDLRVLERVSMQVTDDFPFDIKRR